MFIVNDKRDITVKLSRHRVIAAGIEGMTPGNTFHS